MRAALLALAIALAPAAAIAQDALPTNGPALQKRLEKYDPKAVAAARHYYTQPAIKPAWSP